MASPLRIELGYSTGARQCVLYALDLPKGSTVADALQACLLASECPAVFRLAVGELLGDPHMKTEATKQLGLGIDGHVCTPSQVLTTDARIDLLRPLRIDPKIARRERFQKQGARSAGLFAKRRPGAKPGY